jgi:glycosyltransferase involved in cell wall biosynthesis
MTTLSIVIPAYNEERTLALCVERVLAIAGRDLALELLIVDDASTDRTREIAGSLAASHPNVRLLSHEMNQGKGAALHTGFREATGEFVAVQDADLEYDPEDLLRLIAPLVDGSADVVLGSRFLSAGRHRVLYFWHSVGNKVLTIASNMLTDLNLTDMETCYKVFRRDVIQHLELKEKRFGFEPEIVAKIARLRLRIYEMGISYAGRTYEEGKKIGARDGFRALYCIVRYNMPHAPVAFQFAAYLIVGAVSAVANLAIFAGLITWIPPAAAAPVAFATAAALNYQLSIATVFRAREKSKRWNELTSYSAVVLGVGFLDWVSTVVLIRLGLYPTSAKAVASTVALMFNFVGRRYVVFPESGQRPWKPAGPAPEFPRAAAVDDASSPALANVVPVGSRVSR